MARGFYSLVQYCPDRFRAEVANVGLVLLRLDPHTVRVKMELCQHVFRMFPATHPENLRFSVDGLKNRITAENFQTVEDLARFAASRANDLCLTEPRLAKLDDIDADFEQMFAELVQQPTEEPEEVLRLKELVEKQAQEIAELKRRLAKQSVQAVADLDRTRKQYFLERDYLPYHEDE